MEGRFSYIFWGRNTSKYLICDAAAFVKNEDNYGDARHIEHV